MIIPFGDDDYLLCLNGYISKQAFLEKSQVTGGYAQQLMERIFDCLMTGLVNLREEYQTYYSPEYSDIESFLFWKYSISEEILERIQHNIGSNDLVGYGALYSGGDYTLGQLITSDEMLKVLNSIFAELNRNSHEDKN